MWLAAQKKQIETANYYYLYHGYLSQDVERFSQLSIQNIELYCMEEVYHEKSSLPRTDYQYTSESGTADYYHQEDGLIYLVGYKGSDPYLAAPRKLIQYYRNIPIMDYRNTKSLDQYGETGFAIDYELEELPNNLRSWATKNNYQSLRVNGQLDYQVEYQGEDYIRTGLDRMDGYVIDNIIDLRITSIEVRIDHQWKPIETNAVLLKYFGEKRIHYTSLYHRTDHIEMARLTYGDHTQVQFYTMDLDYTQETCLHNYEDIYLFPNPTFDDVSLKIAHAHDQKYSLTINSIIGKKIWQQELVMDHTTQLFRIDLPYLEQGIYSYIIRDGRGKTIQSRRLQVIGY